MARVYREHPHTLDQGDLLERVPFLRRRLDATPLFESLGVVTSHGCECEGFERLIAAEKPTQVTVETYPLHVAPVYPTGNFEAQSSGLLGDIERGRVRRYFLIPAEDEHSPLVVDFYYEQPVPAALLMNLQRRASLHEDLSLRMLAHLWTFRSHLIIQPSSKALEAEA